MPRAKTLFIELGNPLENGYNKSLNSKPMDELLNGGTFYSLKETKVLVEQQRRHYNAIRTHSSLGYRPPVPETKKSLLFQATALKPERDALNLHSKWAYLDRAG